MNYYPQIEELIKHLHAFHENIRSLEKTDIDTEGINWYSARYVNLSKDDIDYFENNDGLCDEYYVAQNEEGSHYWGQLYFKTLTPNLYICVDFDMF